MTPRPARRRRALPIAVAGMAMTAVLAGCGSAGSAPAPAPHFRDGGSELDTPLSAAVENMKFTDESGRTVRLADYAGKTVVLGDILTLCQEHCPIDTASFVQLAAAVHPDSQGSRRHRLPEHHRRPRP